VTERLVASEEGFRSMELVMCNSCSLVDFKTHMSEIINCHCG
jgi:hypothetical protein